MSDQQKNPGEPASARGRGVGICLVLVAVTFIVYWPVTGFDFILCDDPENFSANPQVQSGLTWPNVIWAFSTTYSSSWYPFTWLSFMLDASLFGKGPQGPHVTNLLLHAANSVLVFVLLNRLTGVRRAEVPENVSASEVAGVQSHLTPTEVAAATQAGSLWRSALVAALFALHPLRVETVAWISDRKDLLCTFFGLLSLMCYARYAQERVSPDKNRGLCQVSGVGGPWSVVRGPECRLWPMAYGLALLFFALGLMSKPMLVTLPFVMLLLDYWPLQRISDFRFLLSAFRFQLWRLVWEKLPFFALTLMSCVFTMIEYKGYGSVIPLTETPLSARIGNMFTAYAQYLGKTFWPVNLTIFHPYQPHWLVGPAGLAMALVLGLCVAALWLGRSRPYLLVGWFWFLGTLVPVIGLVRWLHLSICEHFTYLPLMGVFILLAWGGGDLVARWRQLRTAVVVGAVMILAACALRTRDQLRHWQNSETLFAHALAVTDDNFTAHYFLGRHLLNLGRRDEAREHFRHGLQLRPDDVNALNNLGTELAMRQRYADAFAVYEAVLEFKPDMELVRYNLGCLLNEMGRNEAAEASLRVALRLNPDYTDAHAELARSLVAQGKTGQAMAEYAEVIRLDPHAATAHYNLANLLSRDGQTGEAIAHYQLALKLSPGLVEAHNNLGVALMLSGRPDGALPHFTRALQLRPDYAEAHGNLASALIRLGRREEAVQHLRMVLRLQPGDPGAQKQLRALGAPEIE